MWRLEMACVEKEVSRQQDVTSLLLSSQRTMIYKLVTNGYLKRGGRPISKDLARVNRRFPSLVLKSWKHAQHRL